MSIAQGVVKQTRFKRQTAKGTLASSAAGQILRRTKSTFELVKESYSTEAEITSTQQLLSNRHGVRTVNGKISGILSPGTYADMLSASLRRDFAAVTPVTALGITIAGAGPTYTVTRGTGSWLTDGFKVGGVMRLSVGALNAANINKNLLIVGLTALIATVMPANSVALVAEGPVTGCTATMPGKVTFTPATGQTNIYYTVEEWMSDVPSSERNQDCQATKVDLSLPGSGNATIDLTMIGLDQSAATTALFTSPTVETTTSSLVAASGVLVVGGVAQAVVTDLKIGIDGKGQPADGVVGAVVRPDVFRGKVMVQGSFTAYFLDAVVADAFRTETNSSILAVLTADQTANTDFIAIAIPKIDITSSSPDDQETGLKRTYNFIAEYNAAGGAGTATEATTLWVQDSQAA